MSAADEALRVLIVQHELLDERAAGHVYRQSIAAGKTLDLYLLEEKILEPDDIVKVVEERQKLALACRRCKHVTYLLHGQSADALSCKRCKQPLSGKKTARRPKDSSFQVVTSKRSKVPAVIGVVLFLAASGGLFYAYQQKTQAKRDPGTSGGGGGTQGPKDGPAPTPDGDTAELEVLVSQHHSALAEADWGQEFDCLATRLQIAGVREAVKLARGAVEKDPSLDSEWKDICGEEFYWVYAKTADEEELALKLSMKLSTNEQRQLYIDSRKLLKTEPQGAQTKAKLEGLRIDDGTARGRILRTVGGADSETKVEFVLENEEWRISRLWQ